MNNAIASIPAARAAQGILPVTVASCLDGPLALSLMPDTPFVTPEDLCDPAYAASLSSVQRRRVTAAALMRLRIRKKVGLADGEWRLAFTPIAMARGWLGDHVAETIWDTYGLPTDPKEVFGRPPGHLGRYRGVSATRFIQVIVAIEARYGLRAVEKRLSGLPQRISRLLPDVEGGALSWRDLRLATDLERIRPFGETPSRALTSIPGLADGTVRLAHLEVIERLESCVGLTAAQEIADVIGLAGKAAFKHNQLRNARILEQRFSATDEEGNTLQSIGDRFQMTRERVRQLESKLVDVLAAGEVWTPTGDRLLRLLEDLSPMSLPMAESAPQVVEALGGGASLRAFLRFRSVCAKTTGGLVCRQISASLAMSAIAREQDIRLAHVVRSAAIKLATATGAVHVSLTAGLASEMLGQGIRPAAAERCLQLDPRFTWLDQDQGWGWFGPTHTTRLINLLERLFSALPLRQRIDIEDVHTAISRETRRDRAALGDAPSAPPNIIKEICRNLPWLATVQSDDFVWVPPPGRAPGDALEGVERAIYDFAVARKGLFSRAALTKQLMPTLSYSAMAYAASLAWSPILAHLESGIFKLVGWPVDTESLLQARRERGSTGTLSEVYSGHEVMERPAADAASVSFLYRVGAAAFNARQIHVPSHYGDWFIASQLHVFESDQADGAMLRLSLAGPNDVRLRGLARVFNDLGVTVGDLVRITACRDGRLHVEPVTNGEL